MKRLLLLLLIVPVIMLISCAHIHNFSSEWSYDEQYHYHKCSKCSVVRDEEKHYFMGFTNQDGDMHYFCTICGYHYVQKSYVHKHQYVETWSFDENYHWHECLGCTEVTKEEHQFNDGVTLVVPTIYSSGIIQYTCNICGYIKEDKLDPLPHEHQFNSSDYDFDENYHYQKCSVCNALNTGEEHTFDNGTILLEPTYTTEGKKQYRCLVCGYAKTEVIPIKEHEDD